MNMLCSDKTGTLTKNELTLGDAGAGGRRHARRAPSGGGAGVARATRRTRSMRRFSPALRASQILDRYKVTAFHPFDPVAKRAEAEIEHDGQPLQGRQRRAAGDRRPLRARRRRARRRSPRCVDRDAAKGFRTLGRGAHR